MSTANRPPESMYMLGKYKKKLSNMKRPDLKVHDYAKMQQGYLGEPLVVSGDLINPVEVAHMNTSNVSYMRTAPRVRTTAPVADFIHEDIVERANDFAQHFLCNDDVHLRTESQMFRLMFDHAKTYTELLLKMVEQSKAALNPRRSGKPSFEITGVQTPLESVKDLIVSGKNLDAKARSMKNLQARAGALATLARINTQGNEQAVARSITINLGLGVHVTSGAKMAPLLRRKLAMDGLNKNDKFERVFVGLQNSYATNTYTGVKTLVELAKTSYTIANGRLQEAKKQVDALQAQRKAIRSNLKKLDPSVLRRAGRSNDGNAANEDALMRPIYKSTRKLTGRVSYTKRGDPVLSARDTRLNDTVMSSNPTPGLYPYLDFIHQDPNKLCKFAKPLHTGNGSKLVPLAGTTPTTANFNQAAANALFSNSLSQALGDQGYHLVFSSTPVMQPYSKIGRRSAAQVLPDQIFPAQTLVCQDTRVDSTNRGSHQQWKDNEMSLRQGKTNGVGISSQRGTLPLRSLYGDRLMKRWLVAHSFMDTLSSALYSDFDTSNRSDDHPLFKRFEGVYYKDESRNNNGNNNNNNNSNNGNNGNKSNDDRRKRISAARNRADPTSSAANETRRMTQDASRLAREQRQRAKLSVETHREKESYLVRPTPAQKNALKNKLTSANAVNSIAASKVADALWAVPSDSTNDFNGNTWYIRPDVLDNKVLTKLLPGNPNAGREYYARMLSKYRPIEQAQTQNTKRPSFDKFKLADADGISLQWKEDLRSFGSSGPQSYWIQLMREMYDAIRIRNVRICAKDIRQSGTNNGGPNTGGTNNGGTNNGGTNTGGTNNGGTNTGGGAKRGGKAGGAVLNMISKLSNQQVTQVLTRIRLGDSLGVTEYGYQCRDPLNMMGSWIPSYHRFGRAWYCSDVTSDRYQLPFGVYKDMCAPPRLQPGSSVNSGNASNLRNANARGSFTPTSAKITGTLNDIVINQIMTNVLQQDNRFGTQGRYGHVQTHYNDVPFGKMSPREAYVVAKNLRTYKVSETSDAIDNPLVIDVSWYHEMKAIGDISNATMNSEPSFSRFEIFYGPDLQWSILNARNALLGTGSSEFNVPRPVFSNDPTNILRGVRGANTPREAWSSIGRKRELASGAWTNAESEVLKQRSQNHNGLNSITSGLSDIRNVLETPGRNTLDESGKESVKKYQNASDIVKTINVANNKKNARRIKLISLLNNGNEESKWSSNGNGAIGLGLKGITKYNLKMDQLASRGGGLTNKSRNTAADSDVLNKSVVFCDGEIYNTCDSKLKSYLFAGNNSVLGIQKRYSVEGGNELPVLPLILPLRPSSESFRASNRNALTYFDLMYNDASSGIEGIRDRMVHNIFEPILTSGEITKGMHYNDLMTRYMEDYDSLVNPARIEVLFSNPRSFNLMRCLTFYLYVHAGMSTAQALDQMAKIEASRFARKTQADMYLLARTLRTLGDSGPMPQPLFRKIVKHYLTLGSKNGHMNMDTVKAEVDAMKRELSHFKLFGKEFARRSFLPSFMGGKARANRRMGVPDTSAFRPESALTRVKKFVRGQSDSRVRAMDARRDRAAVGRRPNRARQVEEQILLGTPRGPRREKKRAGIAARRVGSAAATAARRLMP
jgi:hypothetical protein